MRRMMGVLFGALLGLGVLAAPGQAQTKWVMATPYAEGNYHTRNIRAFLEDVEKSTEGRVQVPKGLAELDDLTERFTNVVSSGHEGVENAVRSWLG